MAQDELLAGLITKEEAARQLGKSERTIARMIARRELAHIPGTDFIDVEGSRAALFARVVPAIGAPKKRRST
jgi:predicted DNA-binding transcriptional regulator YafY